MRKKKVKKKKQNHPITTIPKIKVRVKHGRGKIGVYDLGDVLSSMLTRIIDFEKKETYSITLGDKEVQYSAKPVEGGVIK